MKRCKSYHRSNFAFPLGTNIEAANVGTDRAGCAQGVAPALSRTTVQSQPSSTRNRSARPSRNVRARRSSIPHQRMRKTAQASQASAPQGTGLRRAEGRLGIPMPTCSAVNSRRRGRDEWHQPVPPALRVASF